MLHIVLQIPMVPQELHIRAVNLDLARLPHLHIFLAPQRREAPILAHNDLLAAGELVLAASEGLDCGGAVPVTGPHRQKDLADVDAGDGAGGLAVRATHARLQTIGAGARQHFVDADDVVRVCADPQVEAFLAGDFDEVLVGADAGGFEGLGRQLFVFIYVSD